METVAAVFRSIEGARRAAADLVRAGFSDDDISLLLPSASEQQVHSLPTSSAEQPGVGGAIGGVVGAALGIAGGLDLGAAAASVMVPGVGPVLAVGLAGAALLGAGGAVAGAKIGSKVDQKTTEGLPADEIFFYEDALRQCRSLVFVLANGKSEAARARELLAEAGAESLDAAREAWWIGLRDAEEEHYRARGGSFERDQEKYRAGFEAALRPDTRGKPLFEVAKYLRKHYPETWNSDAFQCGFERGQTYREGRGKPATRVAS